MEISLMVSQLNAEAQSIHEVLAAKNAEANALRSKLESLEGEIRVLSDRYDAIHMAADSLGLVCEDVAAPVAPVIEATTVVVPPARRNHSRRPKKIGKYDPKGNLLSEFPSICQAAKAMGWTNGSMAKYIENVSRDKQVRLRGYYLQFIMG